MKIVRSFPHAVRSIENTWIPMPDGTRLAARIWLPEDAERRPVPAILEYIPYRKRDITRARDEANHPYFAGHGYAAIRVDLRGSGDSDGLLSDEYLERELADGEHVIGWIARQPWCSGPIGMIGISWGGFNALQLAARRPEHLRAIITACSTDDRYADDVHYMGGCLLGDNLSWAAAMFAHVTSPPDPEVVGSRWREMWRNRMECTGLWLDQWLVHQRRDAYWEHGSICQDYSSIECPVLAVSGWADGYSNAVFRLLSRLRAPCRGIIGPWGHKYPHLGIPGPAIGFLQECVRWWDHWLKGADNGAMDEPKLRVWMQDSVPPSMTTEHHPGRWVGEAEWPSPNVRQKQYVIARYALEAPERRPLEAPMRLQSPLSVGLFAGKWCSFTATPDLPHDQREEDGGSLVFNGDYLEEPLEILGAPVLTVELSSSRPIAFLVARLSDIGPDHRSTRVTYGVLNLTHRDGHANPVPLSPGERYSVTLKMNDIAYSFPLGHRVRLSLSTSYWPILWPPPEPAMLTIYSGKSTLTLPLRTARAEDALLRSMPEPEQAPPANITLIEPPEYRWTVVRELARDESMLEVVKNEGSLFFDDIDLELRRETIERYSYRHDDFDTVKGATHCVRVFRRGDWNVRVVTELTLTSDRTHFTIHGDLDAYESGQRLHCAVWDKKIARDLL